MNPNDRREPGTGPRNSGNVAPQGHKSYVHTVTAERHAASLPPRSGRGARRGGRGGGIGFKLFYWGAIFALWGGLALGAMLFYFAMTLPDTSALLKPVYTPSLTVLAADGTVLSHRGDLRGQDVVLSQLPPYVPQAVIATEDKRFYSHYGIDPAGLLRAFFVNLRAGHVVQGGSTLTQQLAKNLFLSSDRTARRKIQEMMLAVWLEHKFTKDEILTLYFNRIYLGGGAYGLEAASQRYFNKSARDLTLPEAAMVAGLLKAPSRYSPANDIDAARARTRIVLLRMADQGYITQEQAADAIAHPATLLGYAGSSSVNYFVDWVADSVPSYANSPGTSLITKTTIVPAYQKAAEAAAADILDKYGAKYGVSQVAVVAMGLDGSVKAMIGGRSYAQSQFNRATQAQRQPGSAFKPFVYLTAMEQGMTPETVMNDEPVSINGWSPRNFENRYEGPIPLSLALSKSINTVAAQLGQQVGIANVIRTAQKMGIQSDLEPVPSLALGTASVTLLDLTSAYVPFANGGYGVITHGIDEIGTPDGQDLYQRMGSGPGRVIADRPLAEMNYMLSMVVDGGTGRSAYLPGRPAAGKTGTSQDFRDAWFIGYTADIVVGVWVGNDDGKPMKNVTGGRLPALVWNEFMTTTQKNVAVAALPGNYVPGMAPVAPAPASDDIDNTAMGVDQPTGETTDTATPSGNVDQGFLNRLFSAFSSNQPAPTLTPGHQGQGH
ncbi:MAG: PBP1A family penicillin-binding protein [Parvibaculaceae bacterium]|nr:PBP1A family penicillin-binding protein [Parvibaculaceae bacterium]